jgi:hypothetical protein
VQFVGRERSFSLGFCCHVLLLVLSVYADSARMRAYVMSSSGLQCCSPGTLGGWGACYGYSIVPTAMPLHAHQHVELRERTTDVSQCPGVQLNVVASCHQSCVFCLQRLCARSKASLARYRDSEAAGGFILCTPVTQGKENWQGAPSI